MVISEHAVYKPLPGTGRDRSPSIPPFLFLFIGTYICAVIPFPLLPFFLPRPTLPRPGPVSSNRDSFPSGHVRPMLVFLFEVIGRLTLVVTLRTRKYVNGSSTTTFGRYPTVHMYIFPMLV